MLKLFDQRKRDKTHSTEEFEQWSLWALAQADRIDPLSIGDS
jgi:hypothetical protein